MKALLLGVSVCFFMFSCGDKVTKQPELKEVVKPLYAKGFEIHKFDDGSADLVILNPNVSGDTLQKVHWKPHPWSVGELSYRFPFKNPQVVEIELSQFRKND
jgi:hypothetical protein